MLSIYHRNGIITGPLEAFCLICEGYLKTVEDITNHIEKPVHKKNLDATPYMDRFKDDYIRKVKKGYYCQFCNLLFSTAAKVEFHISEKQHKCNLGLQLLKRESNGVMAFNNVLISKTAWNGIIDETCVVCNTEFDDESIHRTEQTHVLNLIQRRLEFYDNKSLYHMIDESSFHCLTCNEVLAADTIKVHFELSEHKVAYRKCCENASDSPKESINISTNQANKKEENNNDEKVQTKPYKVQATVTTNQTKKSIKIMENKSEKKISKINIFEEKEIKLREVLGASTYMWDEDKGQLMCILCDWEIERSQIPNHLQGQHHLTVLKIHKERLRNMNNADTSETKEKEQPSIGDDDNKNNLLGAVMEFQENDIKINFESGTAVCKKCTECLDFNFAAIDSHIQKHKRQITKKSSETKVKGIQNKKVGGKSTSMFATPVMMKRKDDVKDKQTSRASSVSSHNEEDILEFALRHDLRYTNSKMFCNVCQSELPATFKNMKEHIEGSTHKSKLAEQAAMAPTQDKPKVYQKIPVKEYINEIAQVKTTFLDDIVINRKVCVNIVSFLMMETFQCECCGVQLNQESLDDHRRTPRHLLAMTEAKVLVGESLESEFIREARPGVFHCGYCNIVQPNWDAMEEHLASFMHRESKNSTQWRLQQHLPDVNRHSVVRQMRCISEFMAKLSDNSFNSDDEF